MSAFWSEYYLCCSMLTIIIYIFFYHDIGLKGKAMFMGPSVSSGDISNLKGWVRTDMNKHVCKVCNWSRVQGDLKEVRIVVCL